MRTHAMLPTPWLIDNRIRVFFAACDAELRGRIFYADLSAEFPYPLLSVNPEPCLNLGSGSAFDCDGVNPSCILADSNGEMIMYYIGWRRFSDAIPYTLIAGKAVSSDGGQSFERTNGPLLTRTEEDALFRTAPFVWRSDAMWHMLYIGGERFFDGPAGKRLPIYALRSAVSHDGDCWERSPHPLLEPSTEKGEIGFGRPVLWHDEKGLPTLMLSIRTTGGYRLVETNWNGTGPIKSDFRSVLESGPEQWDAEMTCFGSPLQVGDREVLFYNGNRFGWSGFGIAWRPALAP